MPDLKDPNIPQVSWSASLRAVVEAGTGPGASLGKLPLGSFAAKSLPTEDGVEEEGDRWLVVRDGEIFRLPGGGAGIGTLAALLALIQTHENYVAGTNIGINDAGDDFEFRDPGTGAVTIEDVQQEIEDYLTANGIPGDFATAAEFLAADDVNMLNSETVALAHEIYTITPDGSENVVFDGANSLFQEATIDDDADISAITNLIEGVTYVLKLTASASDRAVTATGADGTANFGAGVSVTSGKTGIFVIFLDQAANLIVHYTGETD